MTAARALARSVQHILEAQTPDLTRANSNITNVIAQIDHASSVMRRMRDFLRRGRPHVSTFDVAEMLNDTLELARPDAVSRGIDLSVQQAEKLPLAHGDRIQLQQVVLNLVRNAIEAMSTAKGASPGGEAPRRHELVVKAAASGPRSVEIAVADTGPGLTAEIAERIFEPFVSTKQDGMGMGLSICRSIVKAHGGRLWAEPRPDGGTIFRFTLAAAPPKSTGR